MQLLKDKQSPDNLISDYLKGELTQPEISQLIDWIKLDQGNKRYFDECCEIWIAARASGDNPGYNIQKGFYNFRQKIKDIEKESASVSGKKILFGTIARYAAIIVITFSLSGLLFHFIRKEQGIQPGQNLSELVVPMGSRAQFLLSDGTIVNLNAGSRLKFDGSFGIKERLVELEGEAYFNVAKNAGKPFIVKTSYLNVTALGTEFNVKAYSTDKTIETTLVNGSIKIESMVEAEKEEITVLEPNQKLTFYKEGSKIVEETAVQDEKAGNGVSTVQKSEAPPRVIKENVNVDPVVSWKENRWIFEQQSLAQIAVELERRFNVQIIIESERLSTFRFTGTIIEEPIEEVLEVMSITAPISFSLKGRVVTLSENKNFEELSRNLYNRKN